MNKRDLTDIHSKIADDKLLEKGTKINSCCIRCNILGVFYCTLREGYSMAKNAPFGDRQRKGMVKSRSQIFNPVTKQWIKRNAETGKFMDVKQDGKPFKGIRKEN